MSTNIQGLLASVATFRVFLGRKKKQDEIIFIFCQQIICEHFSAKTFTLEQLAAKIEETFGLKIPIFALKNAIQTKGAKFIKKDGSCYRVCDNSFFSTASAAEDIQELENMRKTYCIFLEKISSLKNDKDFDQNLYRFLLGDETEVDRKWLVTFSQILEENDSYCEVIKIMKQGLILYEGLSNRVEIKKEKEKIILFLDTEILFHASGYNKGEYKTIFDDFFKLVKKYEPLLLPLYYTDIVEEDVRSIFRSAKHYKREKNLNYTPTSVMEYLMNNFDNESQIETEESNFFYRLEKKFNIKRYPTKYEQLLKLEQNYNIEDVAIRNKFIGSGKTEENVDFSLKSLSFVNMIRKDTPSYLFSSKALLISDTGLTNQIAWCEEIMEEKQIPLSNTLVFFATKLWEFLEVNLGEKVELDIFDPIFNLHFLFKKSLDRDILAQYERAQQDYKKNQDHDMLIHEITDIREKMKVVSECNNFEELKATVTFLEIENARKMEEYRINKAQEDGFKLGIELAKKERILRKQQTRFYRRIQYWNAKTKRMIKKAINTFKKKAKKYCWWLLGVLITTIVGFFIERFICNFF